MKSLIASCGIVALLPALAASGWQAAQAPPDTEIFLAPLKVANGVLEVGTPINITNNPGYDNQPFFAPDGSILFTSTRGTAPGTGGGTLTQTDIYRYHIGSKSVSRVTQTAEGEYSPTVMPDGRRVSMIRVEADGTQRLGVMTPGAPKNEVEVILPEVKPVGYHAWADESNVVMFVLGADGAPATLRVGDVRKGTATIVATDIGRSLQRMPGTDRTRRISFVQRARDGDKLTLTIKAIDGLTREITTLTPAVEGAREADTAWTPDGTLLMAKDGVLYGWKQGQSGWKEVASLEKLSLRGVTRLAVSPAGDYVALVGSASQTR